MRKISGFNKILTACFVLGILFVCMAFMAEPALAAATPTYIASIGITQNSSASSAKSALSGHTIIDLDLNEGADGDYVYMGYKTTTDPYKAITGIVMIAGMALGPQVGFMTGAVSAFASNFFYSQGPWTPWQMLAYGMGGFLAGVLFYKRTWSSGRLGAVLETIFAFLAVILVVGPLLDACTIFTTGSRLSWRFAFAVLAAGFPHNVIHGLSCAATVLLLSKPLLTKLNRLKTKYGMME